MKKQTRKLTRVLSVVLSLLIVVSVISLPTFKSKAAAGTLDDFIERCYTVTLDRPSDTDGFNYWKGRVLNGEAVGIEVAYGFLFSPEYTKKDKTNTEFVTDLYTLFMGRDPDEGGFNDWMSKLDEGASRLDVYAGFANSPEFYNICKSYGITAGRYVKGYSRDTNNNVNLYVERLYKICLDRIGDKDGQKNWVEQLIKGEITGTECARRFIFSTEYTNKNLSDEEFVENLYLAMFGRPSDASGKAGWLEALDNGNTRDEVFAGFANSPEFDNMCKAYGINRGSYTATHVCPYKVGDIIKFGKYEQDGNLSNGKEDIEWVVLSVKSGKAFVTSKYVLDYLPFDTEGVDVCWETSSLREWLNNDFYNDSFSENEKQSITLSTIKNINNPRNSEHAEPLNDTDDKVFLLSVEEVMTYFGECIYYDEEYDWYYYPGLFIEPTEYAKMKGIPWWTLQEYDYEDMKECGFTREQVIGEKCTEWFLRSQAGSSDCANCVWAGCRTGYHENTLSYEPEGVRPAMYISY
ncbi:MAG: DUF4214 domain-containing protein [Lachnospiraceae bacterium]|nr:DUF4214 domain-containing protein [Lachnospiraceae bacterium]